MSVAGDATLIPAKPSVFVASSVFVPARRTVTVAFVTEIGAALASLVALRYRFEIVNTTFEASTLPPPTSSGNGMTRMLTMPSVFVPETTQSPIMCSVFVA